MSSSVLVHECLVKLDVSSTTQRQALQNSARNDRRQVNRQTDTHDNPMYINAKTVTLKHACDGLKKCCARPSRGTDRNRRHDDAKTARRKRYKVSIFMHLPNRSSASSSRCSICVACPWLRERIRIFVSLTATDFGVRGEAAQAGRQSIVL